MGSCAVTDPFASIIIPPFTQATYGLSNVPFTLPVYNITSRNLITVVPLEVVCENTIIPLCQTISVVGTNSICTLDSSFTYRLTRHDNRNDTYQPTAFVPVKSFMMQVYNRWGQLVFETSDIKKGWDGKVAGKPQDAGIYVYICRYLFFGEQQSQKLDKGNFLLMR